MGAAWWQALDKDKGSRPRCVLLTDGSSQEVAARLADLVGLPDVTVSASDLWLSMGKPIRTNKGWDAKPSAEAQIHRNDGFVAATVRRELAEWWLEVIGSASKTPQWDIAATCSIEEGETSIFSPCTAHLFVALASGRTTATLQPSTTPILRVSLVPAPGTVSA